PPARNGGDKSKSAPDEDQHGDGYGYALCEFGAHYLEQPAEHQVEEDVGGLRYDHQSLGAAAFDQLGQPGVVDVAGKITGLDARLPVTWRQHQQRDQNIEPSVRQLAGAD